MSSSIATVVDGFLTIRQAEERYGVKRATIYRYVQQGKLRTYRRGMDRRSYLSEAEMDELRRVRAGAEDAETRRRGAKEWGDSVRALRQRLWGGKKTEMTAAELIEEGRREREAELPEFMR